LITALMSRACLERAAASDGGLELGLGALEAEHVEVLPSSENWPPSSSTPRVLRASLVSVPASALLASARLPFDRHSTICALIGSSTL